MKIYRALIDGNVQFAFVAPTEDAARNLLPSRLMQLRKRGYSVTARECTLQYIGEVGAETAAETSQTTESVRATVKN